LFWREVAMAVLKLCCICCCCMLADQSYNCSLFRWAVINNRIEVTL
jgi:hypothetical protein